MKPPRKKSKAYKEIVKLGCLMERHWTDCGYEYDCGGEYEWDCDYCPVVVENEERKIASKESIKKMNEDIEKLFNAWIEIMHTECTSCDSDSYMMQVTCTCQENFLKMYKLEKEIAECINKRLVLYKDLVKE